MSYIDYKIEEQAQHPTIQKHLKLLEALSEDQVFGILRSDSESYMVVELCDCYFAHNLAKDECAELSEMFAEMAEETEEV